ncbi:hypothetical protein V2S66_13915 [Streptomyces sp. V4-01]|uniref:Uncharacterized protein n=1 Tax=Actinacidiphila polyblastidii TaxID=3110430 RepID=A0ABU7PB64_9ACTN|nr:hypothetical protein [Streptomyces sp. V4-01]
MAPADVPRPDTDGPGARRAAAARRPLPRRLLFAAGGVLAVAGGGAAVLGLRGRGGGDRDDPQAPPFSAQFGDSGLVTNEYAYRHPGAAGARVDADWSVTSGSLFARDGDGWTGRPDTGETGTDSRSATDSAVFRLVTRRRDFADVTVRSAILLHRPVSTPRTPRQDYDGGHIWLRYHSPEELYALSFRRRDGVVVIKRKVPASDAAAANGGDYTTVEEARHAFSYDAWHTVTATARNEQHGVRLRLEIDRRTVLSTLDTSPGPLRRPGGVGLRADNTELLFRAFTATAAS